MLCLEIAEESRSHASDLPFLFAPLHTSWHFHYSKVSYLCTYPQRQKVKWGKCHIREQEEKLNVKGKLITCRKARSSFIVLNYSLWIPFKYCCCFFVKACESVFCHWHSLARMITKACPLLMASCLTLPCNTVSFAFFWGKVNSKFCSSLSLWYHW